MTPALYPAILSTGRFTLNPGGNAFQQSSPTSATQRRQGQQTCFGWHGCRPAPIRPTQWLTRANGDCFFCILGNGVLFVNGIIIPAWSKRAFLLSALRPSGRPKWVRAPARKKRLAANGKPNALLALPKGRWAFSPRQPLSTPLILVEAAVSSLQ